MAIAANEVVSSAVAASGMKRIHRRWHRRIGWFLVPVIVLTLAMAGFMRELPTDNATLPPVLMDVSEPLGSR